jgi:hypothetical protein
MSERKSERKLEIKSEINPKFKFTLQQVQELNNLEWKLYQQEEARKKERERQEAVEGKRVFYITDKTGVPMHGFKYLDAAKRSINSGSFGNPLELEIHSLAVFLDPGY